MQYILFSWRTHREKKWPAVVSQCRENTINRRKQLKYAGVEGYWTKSRALICSSPSDLGAETFFYWERGWAWDVFCRKAGGSYTTRTISSGVSLGGSTSYAVACDHSLSVCLPLLAGWTRPAQPAGAPAGVPARVPARVPTRVPSRISARVPSRSWAGSPARSPAGSWARSPARVPDGSPAGSSARSWARSPARIPARPWARSPAGIPAGAPAGIPTRSWTRSPAGSPEWN